MMLFDGGKNSRPKNTFSCDFQRRNPNVLRYLKYLS